MKKIFSAFRNILVFFGWTYVFVFITNALISAIWNFEYISTASWKIFSTYWNSGGVLKTSSDILLLLVLFLLPILFIMGFFWAKKQNYITIFTYPIIFVYNLFNSSSITDEERIIIKKTSKSQTADDIKNEIESLKPQKPKKAGEIRTQIIQKITDEIKK